MECHENEEELLIVIKQGEVSDVNTECRSCPSKIHLPRISHTGITWSNPMKDFIMLCYFDCFQDMGYTNWLTNFVEQGRWQGLGTA